MIRRSCISVAVAAVNLFIYFFVWEWNYRDPSSAFVFAILGQLPLYALWLIWFVLTVVLIFVRWKTQRWLTLVPVVVMLSPLVLGFFISGTTLWVDYNYAAVSRCPTGLYAEQAGGHRELRSCE